MNIKMVAVDLDGTLLNGEKKITPVTAKAVADAMENGVEVVISTGRVYAEFQSLLEVLPHVRYAVTCTGASVMDCRTREELFLAPLNPEDVRSLYAVLRPYDMIFEVFVDGVVYAEAEKVDRSDYYMEFSHNPALPGSRTGVSAFEGWLESLTKPVAKLHMYFRDTAQRDAAWDAVRDMPFSIASSDETDLEIMANGVDKGRGLRHLAQYLRIDRSQVMAVGDSLNDQGMLDYAGVCAVMSNGLPQLKAQADIVADSNERNGVAKLLNALRAGELSTKQRGKRLGLQ